MARLNEFTVPTPTESVEALKRRFVRQNREIARVNSLQSLRIRTLEAEVSRLLGENVSLREQLIALNSEIERLEAGRTLHEGIYSIKAKLDTKLAEMNKLVLELGLLPRKVGRHCDRRPETHTNDEQRSSIADFRRKATETQDPSNPDDGRLPVILEGHHYPRTTLEPQDIENLVNAGLESPTSPRPTGVLSDHLKMSEDNSMMEPTNTFEYQSNSLAFDDSFGNERYNEFSHNLDIRNRKTSAPVEFGGPEDPGNVPPSVMHSPSFSKRPNVKRKFVSDDTEERYGGIASAGDGDFHFSRTAPAQKRWESPAAVLETSTFDDGTKFNEDHKVARQSSRKVLEPKSVNTDPSSPHRTISTSISATKSKQKRNPRLSGDANSVLPTKKPVLAALNASPESNDRVAAHETRDSVISPKRHDSAGGTTAAIPQNEFVVRPDSDSESGTGVTAGPTRSTRRPRGVVSYAEPNLRDKMRRPTKELVDAVGGEHYRRSSSSHTARRSFADDPERVDNSLTRMATDVGMPLLASENEVIEEEAFRSHSRPADKKPSSVSQRKPRTLFLNDYDMNSTRAAAGTTSNLEPDFAPQPIRNETGPGDASELEPHFDGEAAEPALLTAKRPSRRHSSTSRSSIRVPAKVQTDRAADEPSTELPTLPSKAIHDSSRASRVLQDKSEVLNRTEADSGMEKQKGRVGRVNVRRKTMMV